MAIGGLIVRPLGGFNINLLITRGLTSVVDTAVDPQYTIVYEFAGISILKEHDCGATSIIRAGLDEAGTIIKQEAP